MITGEHFNPYKDDRDYFNCSLCLKERSDRLIIHWLQILAFKRSAGGLEYSKASRGYKLAGKASYLWLDLICSLCTSHRCSAACCDLSFSGLVANLFRKTKPSRTNSWLARVCSVHKSQQHSLQCHNFTIQLIHSALVQGHWVRWALRRDQNKRRLLSWTERADKHRRL